MAKQQGRLSRFGLSWFSALRGATQPQLSQPKEGSAAVQRPPFRPAGKAPRQTSNSQSQVLQKSEPPAGKAPSQPSPSQNHAQQKSETQTPPPSRTSKTKATSKPSPQSHSTNQRQAASVPSLPPQKASLSQEEKQAAKEGQSPSPLATERSGQKEAPTFSASAPTNNKARQTREALTDTPSPSYEKVESATKDSIKPSAGAVQPSRSTSQEAAKAAVSHALSQEARSNAKSKVAEEGIRSTSSKPPQEPNSKAEFKLDPRITSRNQEDGNPLASQKPAQEVKPNAEFKAESGLTSKNHNIVKTSEPDSGTNKPTQIPGPAREEERKTRKADFKTNNGKKLTSKSERKLEKPEEKWKVVQERIKEVAKGTSQKNEEPMERTTTKLSTATSGKKTNDITTSFQGHKFQEKQKISDNEKKVSNSKGSAIKNPTSAQSKSTHNISARTHQGTQASNVQKAPFHKDIDEDISQYAPKMTTGNSTKLLMDDNPVSVITVAGENKGATMHLDSSSRKDDLIPIRRGYKLNRDESSEATTDGEETSKGRKPTDQDSKKEDSLSKAYINSNLQSINNSLLFSSSLNERNPGVHFAVSWRPSEPFKPCCQREPLMPRRVESKVTPAGKRTYEPRLRRRCLRGLLLEPSDSDPENPDKPRRHGCKVSCDNNKF